MAWTPDGTGILFRRLRQTSIGPPGLYYMRLSDRAQQYIMPATLYWPETASFSPDGQHFVVSFALTLRIVDLRTRTYSTPFYTARGADYPAWLSDGRIAYTRVFGLRNVPDSNGTHIFDPVSGTDEPVLYQGAPLIGRFLAVSRVTGQVAIEEPETFPSRVLIASPRLTDFELAQPPNPFRLIGSIQWIFDPILGSQRMVLLRDPDSSHVLYGSVALDIASGTYEAYPSAAPPFDKISPDGKYLLIQGVDPATGAIVLFIRTLGDPLARPPEQVTRIN